MDELIAGLSSTGFGCSIGSTTINNIIYANNAVLLCKSIIPLTRLLKICEEYAMAHGLRYNTNKGEIMVFKASN